MSDDSEPLRTAAQVRELLRRLASPARAEAQRRYFKTGPGEYGEGDVFLGVTVPEQRALVRKLDTVPTEELEALLRSVVHEERLTALLALVRRYEQAKKDPAARRALHELYLANLAWVNNWDLVDSSAKQLVGAWLLDKDRSLLDSLASSKVLWERRVAVLATFAFLEAGETEWSLRLAKALLRDPEDLLHKAVGWMLRELGEKCGLEHLRAFLAEHAAEMPRTMLRYALEKLPEAERARWMREGKPRAQRR